MSCAIAATTAQLHQNPLKISLRHRSSTEISLIATTCSSTKCILLHHLQLWPLHHLQCSVLLLPLPHAAAHVKIAENIVAVIRSSTVICLYTSIVAI